MANIGDVRFSQGNAIEFLETSRTSKGARVTVRATYAPRGKYPPTHLHPRQTETFTVIDGELRVRSGGQQRTYKAGETFRVPRGVPHAMCNASSKPTVVDWVVEPALRREAFFETLYDETPQDRGRRGGIGRFLRRVALLLRFKDEVVFVWRR